MRRPPSTAVTRAADDESAHAAALRAIRHVHAASLSDAIARILDIARHALPAHRAAFWRIDAGGREMARSCSAGESPATERTLTCDEMTALLAERASRPRQTCNPATLSALHVSPRTRCVLLQPVHVRGAPPGALCFELEDADARIDAETALFTQLVAAYVENRHLDESRGGPDDANEHYALQQSHLALDDASLRDVFYLAPVAMLLSDPHEARPLAVNRHALALFGISTQRSDNLHMHEFWEDADERRRFVEHALAMGHVRDRRVRLRKTDGRLFWAQISATIIDYHGKPALMSSITDVSDTVAAEEILNRTQKTLTTLLEASPYPLIVTRLDTGVIRFCNQKAADMFETPVSGLLGHTAPEFYVKPSDRNYFVEKLREAGKVEGFVAKLKTHSGQPFWAMLSAKTLELNDEPVFMVAFADVTKQKHKEEELETLAFRDGLTNAYNRRYFVEAARIELARAERNTRPPVLALLDIDHFKQLNDTFGHETGDAVLREFVQIVQGMLRKTDILARYGGEEFAILFPETELEPAFEIVERIRAMVAAHDFAVAFDERAWRITFSAGIAAMPGNAGYPELVQLADAALYSAKRGGRNRVTASMDDA